MAPHRVIQAAAQLKCITYSSYASPGIQPLDLEAILRTSVRNNARDAITGVLMFNGAMFVQTIEGPAESIDRLMSWLAEDVRHCAMAVRDQRVLTRRIFPDWSMGYVRLDGGWLEGQYEVLEALARPMPREMHDILVSLAETLPFG